MDDHELTNYRVGDCWDGCVRIIETGLDVV